VLVEHVGETLDRIGPVNLKDIADQLSVIKTKLDGP
jgi:hypothetical protein